MDVSVVRSAWRRTAHPKEKGGAVTARRLWTLSHKDLASLTVNVQGIQDLLIRVNAPAVRKRSTLPLAFSQPSVRTPLVANMEFKVSVDTQSGREATASQLERMER